MYCIQAIDKEALGLLRWLAMSQTVEYINSDDELVCEIVLSPFGRGAKRSPTSWP
jgi:DNA polymerase zeta